MKFSVRSFAIGVLVTMVLGSGTAVAATGGKFILGYSNSANRTSSIVNTAGIPLALSAKAGSAPLAVNSKVRVGNLNSDLVDGLDSTHFARSSANTGLFFSTTVETLYDEDGVTAIGAFAWRGCPTGTVVTGGSAFSYEGSVVIDNYKEGNGWAALTDDPTATDSFGVNVVCWNPKGALASQPLRTAPNAELRAAARAAR